MDIDSSKSSSLKDTFEAFNLTQHIDFPTHLFGHTLDLLITPSDFEQINNVKSLDIFTDHFSISSSISLDQQSSNTTNIRDQYINYRKYHDINMQPLRDDFLKSDLFCRTASNAFDLLNQYNETSTTLLNKHAPPMRKKTKKNF